jgi:hypothetical protein
VLTSDPRGNDQDPTVREVSDGAEHALLCVDAICFSINVHSPYLLHTRYLFHTSPAQVGIGIRLH